MTRKVGHGRLVLTIRQLYARKEFTSDCCFGRFSVADLQVAGNRLFLFRPLRLRPVEGRGRVFWWSCPIPSGQASLSIL